MKGRVEMEDKRKARVVVAGGGWGGCAAAASAARAGAEAVLVERTDMLLGTGLVGGIFRNNGRFTAAEEMLGLGADIMAVMDACARHRNVSFPGHEHASLYDVYRIEPAIRAYLGEIGVRVVAGSSIADVGVEGNRVCRLVTRTGETIEGDAFVDATGTSATPGNCVRHGRGCAMCILRCHSFFPRVSITGKAGVEEWDGRKEEGKPGAMSGSCKLFKESLAPWIVERLDREGVCLVPVPPEIREGAEILGLKACQQYALPEFIENLVLLDTGPAKLMTPFFPLGQLRKIPGMEKARYEDPIAGGQGNSMRFFGFAACGKTLQALGPVENLFCAGEKGGAMVGHTEAVVSGSLAGHNAARAALGLSPVCLPGELAVGDFVGHVTERMQTEEGRRYKYTFSGSVYFGRMKEKGLYSTDPAEIAGRVRRTGMEGFLARPVQ